MRWSGIEKTAAFAAVLVWLALGGYFVATRITPDAKAGDGPVLRTMNGAAQTGAVEAVTVNGAVRHVIRWKTKDGTLTQTVTGPDVRPNPIFVAGPTSTAPGATHTVRGAGSTVTLPGQTVTQSATETVHDTVTETVQNTATETETVTVTETVTAPTP